MILAMGIPQYLFGASFLENIDKDVDDAVLKSDFNRLIVMTRLQWKQTSNRPVYWSTSYHTTFEAPTRQMITIVKQSAQRWPLWNSSPWMSASTNASTNASLHTSTMHPCRHPCRTILYMTRLSDCVDVKFLCTFIKRGYFGLHCNNI